MNNPATQTNESGQAVELIRLIRLPELMTRVGLSRPAIYKAVVAGRFPRPIKIGSASRWSSEEVTAWIKARVDESRPAVRAE